VIGIVIDFEEQFPASIFVMKEEFLDIFVPEYGGRGLPRKEGWQVGPTIYKPTRCHLRRLTVHLRCEDVKYRD
jgi:hypothetical protein